MKEEKVTKNILDWLEDNGWNIICYDFPQSGTGVLLHLNNEKRTEKNKGGIIPDIIAIKSGNALFFENKDRFYEPDFDKLNEIRTKKKYSNSLDLLLDGFEVKNIYYGIGIPESEIELRKAKSHFQKIDFLISTNREKKVVIHYDINEIFINT